MCRIGWTVIAKSRPEHDPKWTRYWDLLPTGSSCWRHFRWNVNALLNILKLLAFVLSEIFKENHFVTAEVAAADTDDSYKRKRICVLLKNWQMIKVSSVTLWWCLTAVTAKNNCQIFKTSHVLVHPKSVMPSSWPIVESLTPGTGSLLSTQS